MIKIYTIFLSFSSYYFARLNEGMNVLSQGIVTLAKFIRHEEFLQFINKLLIICLRSVAL